MANFLWNGKRPKIKKQLLENCTMYGGVKLTNLCTKDMSIKIKWVQTLHKDTAMANLAYENIQPVLRENVWKLNLRPTEIADVWIKNKFWEDVMISWAYINFQDEVKDPTSQIIWFNSHIKIANGTFFWKQAFLRGLVTISDLLTEQRHIRSSEVLTREYGIDTLQINMLISAIPKHWWQKIKNKDTDVIQRVPEIKNKFDDLMACKQISAKAYALLNKTNVNKMALLPKYEAWKCDLSLSIDYDTFLMHFVNIKKFTNITKYRSFQYRLLNRAIFTGDKLFKWKIIDSPLCVFCHSELETVSHLFFECLRVREMWSDIVEYVENKYKMGKSIELNVYAVIFNAVVSPPQHLYNFIVLVVKQYIHAQRCKGQDLSTDQVIAIINKLQCNEKYIAVSTSSISKHMKKWHPNTNCFVEGSLDEFILDYVENL